jgi:hypothetical protein
MRKKRATIFDLYKSDIIEYLRIGLNTAAIVKIINDELPNPVSTTSLHKYIKPEGLDNRFKK